jgi:hypothetical protein
VTKQQHYESFYKSAVWCLKDLQGIPVGEEQKTHDGVRFREIDGKSATDDAIFELAWGRETADHVRRTWKL